MSWHLFGIVVTPHGTAANNRGDNDGNTTTLQKLLWHGDVHTTVSAEAIRWAVRYAFQQRGLAINRIWQEEQNLHDWRDPDFARGPEAFADDDVLGFMSAEAAKAEAGDTNEVGTTPSAGSKKKARGTVSTRRARLEVTRAVSLTPWGGDITFNAASVGATPKASSTGKDPVPYATEFHATRYQYGFALTPESLAERERALYALEAIGNLGEVGGNHARFLYDFAPESIVLRWTQDPAPRMLYGFQLGNQGATDVPAVVRNVGSGDIDAAEVIVGGRLADGTDGQTLHAAGAAVFPGVKAAIAEAERRMRGALGLG